MTRRLGADPAYPNQLAKNPLHPRWRASWLNWEPFDLNRLLEPLGREDTRPSVRRREIAGISRNCDLFDDLRCFAYVRVLAYKEKSNLDTWCARLLEEARAINSCFSLPLSIGELRQIARSVAKWTWRKFNPLNLSLKTLPRAKRGEARPCVLSSQQPRGLLGVIS